MALILEVLNPRTGEVETRVRLDGLPVTLGRGYGNDVILDDPYVDPLHARIALDETGTPVIEDLGSVNGVVEPGSQTHAPRLVVRPNLHVRLGRTTIRFRDRDAPVAAALLDIRDRPHALTLALAKVGTPRGLVAVSTAAILAIAGVSWLGSYDRSGAGTALAGALGFAVVASMWAGVWAIAGRILVHRFGFWYHFAVTAVVALLILAYATVDGWVSFFFPDNLVSTPAGYTFGLALFAAQIAAHLAIATTMSRRRRWRAGLVTSGVVLALVGLVMLSEREMFSDVAEFPGELKPVGTRWLPVGTVDEFSLTAGDLKREVDELAAKK